jgi:hypothetical protein
MTALTNNISNTFNAFADKAEQLWDKAVVKTLDSSARTIGAVADVGVSFAKAGAVALPVGTALGGALYASGGFHVDSMMQALQGGAVVFGSIGTMLGTMGHVVDSAHDDNSVADRVTDKITTYKNDYAARNNVQLAQPNAGF